MIIQRALDIAVPDKNMRLLFSLVATLIAIYVVSVIFTTIRSRIMVDVSQNIIYDIRKDLFEHLQELPFQYYDDRPHGKILIRVVNYVNSVSDMLSNGLINIVLEAFNLLFIIIFMFMVDVQMALVVLCGVPVLAVFMFWIKNKQRKAWQAVSNKNSNLNAYLQEKNVDGPGIQLCATQTLYGRALIPFRCLSVLPSFCLALSFSGRKISRWERSWRFPVMLRISGSRS